MMAYMALEKPKEFIGEHKTEFVAGSVLTMLGSIGLLAAKSLNVHKDAEQGPAVPDDPTGNS